MRVVSITVFRNALGDCTNGGASSFYDSLYLFSEDSTTEEIADYADGHSVDYERCFKVETMSEKYGFYKRANPAFRLRKGTGPMAGGNYGGTCDSRYETVTGGLKYPIPIHDRYEDMEDYLLND